LNKHLIQYLTHFSAKVVETEIVLKNTICQYIQIMEKPSSFEVIPFCLKY